MGEGKGLFSNIRLGFNDEIIVPKKVNNPYRFTMLVFGMFCSIPAGALYAFSLISNKMSTDYHYNQNDLTTISTIGIVVGSLTLPFGILYDYIGPKPLFMIGTITYVIGALLYALVFTGSIGHSIAGLSAINAIATLGGALFDMSSILTVLSWFPLDRGLVVACIKTTTGLGASVISTFYTTYFIGKESAYMSFLLILVGIIGIFSFFVFSLPPFHMIGYRESHYTLEEREKAKKIEELYLREKAPIKRYLVAFVILGAIVIVIFTRSIAFVYIENPSFVQNNTPTIIMIILYFMLFLVLLPISWLDKQPAGYDREAREAAERIAARELNLSESSSKGSGLEETEPLYPDGTIREEIMEVEGTVPDRVASVITMDEITEDGEDKIAPQYPTGFTYNMRRPVLIGLWITGFCVAGLVNVVAMNQTQIYNAVAGSDTDVTRPGLYIAITNIGSAVGRLVMSGFEVVSQSSRPEDRTPITLAYCISPILGFFSSIFFLFVPLDGLILPMMLAGLVNGFYSAAEVLVIRTIFSVDVAKHYNSLFIFEMLGVIFMNRLLFGELMSKNSTNNEKGVPACLDRTKCLQVSFIVLAVVSLVGVASSLWMHFSYAKFAKAEFERRAARRALRLQGNKNTDLEEIVEAAAADQQAAESI